MTEDEKQEKKAKEDVAENGKDTQTEKDRVDESVGEQEKRDGDENSQSAKDRVDESEGSKKADGEREEKEEKAPAWADKMIAALGEIVALLKKDGEGEKEPDLGVGLTQDERARTEGGNPRSPYLDRYKG